MVYRHVYSIYVYMYVRGCMYPCINMCMCIHGHSMYIWKIINNITVHTGTANVHGIVLFLCFLAPCISFVCVYMRVCVSRVRVRVVCA